MTKTKRDFYYDGFSTPNGTLVPDDVFDVLLPELRLADTLRPKRRSRHRMPRPHSGEPRATIRPARCR